MNLHALVERRRAGKRPPRPGVKKFPAKWILLQGGTLLLLALGSTLLIQRGEILDEARKETSRGRSIADLLAQAAGPEVSFYDSTRLLRYLDCAVRSGDLLAGAVLDEKGIVVAHTDIARRGTRAGSVLSEAAVAAGDSPEWVRALFGEETGRVVVRPLLNTSGNHGAVALLLPDSPSPILSPAALRFFIPAGLLLLAFIVVSQAIVRWAVRPTSEFLEKLAETLEAKDAAAAEEDRRAAAGQGLERTVSQISELMETKDGLLIRNRLLTYEKKRMELILEAYPDGILVTNMLKEILFANRKALSLAGGTGEGITGKVLHEVPELFRLIRDGDKAGQKIVGVSLGGAKREILVSRIPLAITGGRNAGTLYAFRDVTARHAAQTAQAEFLSQVSHELKAPLNTMVTFVEELAENENLTAAERKEYCNNLTDETNRMARLISNLLQISRIELGNLSVNFGYVKAGSLVREQADSLRAHAAGRGLSLLMEVPENLPPVSGDKDLLGVAVNNLISNAVKYTPEGGKIVVRAGTTDGGLAVDIEDTGIGIPDEARAKIFERFYRAEQEEVRQRQGTGLGLSLVKEIVEAHGGKISVESDVGSGSRFRMWIPVREAGTKLDTVESPV